MSTSNSIKRATEYFKRYGLSETIRRASQGARRALFANRMVVYCCDLAITPIRPVSIPESMTIERLRNESELRSEDREAINSFWNPDLARRNMQDRFQKGATLWLIRSGESVAGYGWTIQGRPISPYYFPILPGDVQFFDFLVFPKFRGRAIQWLLTAHIFQALKSEGASRAFADTHEWNQAQLASFKMTTFKPIGMARRITLFDRSFTTWSEMDTGEAKRVSAALGVVPPLSGSAMSTKNRERVRAAEDLKLHHFGFVVKSIQDCALSFAEALGASWDGEIFFDPLQKVRVTFFSGRNIVDPLIELVEPGGDDSPVTRFLERGGGLHHLCYEVNDLEGHLEFCRSVGNTIIRPPVPAVAFGGRRIAWAVTRKKLLVEFLER